MYNSNVHISGRRLKDRLKKLRKYECEVCKLKGEWQGKPLTLQVNHINGLNTNNTLTNLRFICPNCHTQTNTFAGRNLRGKDFGVCPECKDKIEGKTKLCKNCRVEKVNKSAILRLNKKGVTKDILKNKLLESNFLQVGKYYKVSDNAVRKWCRIFNLPTNSTSYNKNVV